MANISRFFQAHVGRLVGVMVMLLICQGLLNAAPIACGDKQAIDLIQNTAADKFNMILFLATGGQASKVLPDEIAVSDTYTISATDSIRICDATIAFLPGDSQEASAEVHYETVLTDDGKDLVRWGRPQNEIVPLIKSVFAAKKPSDEDLRNFYAPQGPGSSSARNREWNQEHGQR